MNKLFFTINNNTHLIPMEYLAEFKHIIHEWLLQTFRKCIATYRDCAGIIDIRHENSISDTLIIAECIIIHIPKDKIKPNPVRVPGRPDGGSTCFSIATWEKYLTMSQQDLFYEMGIKFYTVEQPEIDYKQLLKGQACDKYLLVVVNIDVNGNRGEFYFDTEKEAIAERDRLKRNMLFLLQHKMQSLKLQYTESTELIPFEYIKFTLDNTGQLVFKQTGNNLRELTLDSALKQIKGYIERLYAESVFYIKPVSYL